jgi:hypothetical protein
MATAHMGGSADQALERMLELSLPERDLGA